MRLVTGTQFRGGSISDSTYQGQGISTPAYAPERVPFLRLRFLSREVRGTHSQNQGATLLNLVPSKSRCG